MICWSVELNIGQRVYEAFKFTNSTWETSVKKKAISYIYKQIKIF